MRKSAWQQGVELYAQEFKETYMEYLKSNGYGSDYAPPLMEILLNGASDWSEYSYGGSSLIYDADIAERLCSPSELKRKRGGELPPNSRESWLDVQARALYQAAVLVYTRQI